MFSPGLKSMHAFGVEKIVRASRVTRPSTGTFVMAAVLLILGFFLVWPIILLLINSFNVAMDWFVEPRRCAAALGNETVDPFGHGVTERLELSQVGVFESGA